MQSFLITLAYGAVAYGLFCVGYDVFIMVRNWLQSGKDASDDIAHGDNPHEPRTFRDTTITRFTNTGPLISQEPTATAAPRPSLRCSVNAARDLRGISAAKAGNVATHFATDTLQGSNDHA